MFFCTKCGTMLSEGVAFCAVCGAPVSNEISPGAEAAVPPAAPDLQSDEHTRRSDADE